MLLTLNCEVQSRVEKTDKLLPDMVFRLRVLNSDLKYDNLTVTHVPGIGGDLAQALGDGVHSSVSRRGPSLEAQTAGQGQRGHRQGRGQQGGARQPGQVLRRQSEAHPPLQLFSLCLHLWIPRYFLPGVSVRGDNSASYNRGHSVPGFQGGDRGPDKLGRLARLAVNQGDLTVAWASSAASAG